VEELDRGLTNSKLVIYPDGGHGTQLLTSQPELLETLTDWLASQIN